MRSGGHYGCGGEAKSNSGRQAGGDSKEDVRALRGGGDGGHGDPYERSEVRYGCPERKVVRSRRRVLRTCSAIAKQAHSRVRKARIEMANKTCMQLAKDNKVVHAEGCRGITSIFADAS
jgi:hypothetical protein